MSLHCFENGGSISIGCHGDLYTIRRFIGFTYTKRVLLLLCSFMFPGEQWWHHSARYGSTSCYTDLVEEEKLKEPRKENTNLNVFGWQKRERLPWFSCPLFREGNGILFLATKANRLGNWTVFILKGEATCSMLLHKFLCMEGGIASVRIGHPFLALAQKPELPVGEGIVTWRPSLDLASSFILAAGRRPWDLGSWFIHCPEAQMGLPVM